jgi:hypothetical protein
MKKFLFVIPQSPQERLSPFRKSLTEISMLSLKNQKNQDWEAVFLGQNSHNADNFHFLNLGGITKEEKLHYFVDWIKKQNDKPEYLIRFDDDDLISPFVLEKISGMDFDCYADQWHWFYDSSSGNCSRQKRSWLPNTVIHKTEHALATYGEYHKGVFSADRKPMLLQNDHSQTWSEYYSKRKLVFAEKNQPIYLRVLSPSSITAGEDSIFDTSKFEKYRRGFGTWDAIVPKGFSEYIAILNKIWIGHYGKQFHYQIPFTNRIKSKIEEWFS